MTRYTFEGINPKKIRRKVGIRRRTFLGMVSQVRAYLEEECARQPLHKRGRKALALSLTDTVLLTFIYLWQYPTFDELGDMFGISESYANKLYHRYLDILVQVLRLPGKKALLNQEFETLLIDVTEQPIERPVSKQRQWFSGKQKRHTLKTQLIICANTLQILWVVGGKGRTHDFKLLKRCKLKILADICIAGDSGYQGIQKLFANTTTPHKKPRGGTLTKAQKQENRAFSVFRVPIEPVNRRCKIFRIVKDTYRGKHKNYQKTWTVVAELVNLRYT